MSGFKDKIKKVFIVNFLLLIALIILSAPVSAQQYGDFEYELTDPYGLTNVIRITHYTGGGGNVVIPDSIDGFPVTVLGIDCFYGCANITNVLIPNSVVYLEDQAFAYCTSLRTIILPDSVKSMANYMFRGCSSLTNVKLSSGIDFLSPGTFNDCVSLTAYDIPQSIKSIGVDAFNGCTNLIGITIPESIESIPMNSFIDCTALKSIQFNSSTTIISENSTFPFPIGATIIGHDPSTAKDYATTYGNTFQVIEDNDPVDGDSDFKYEIING